MSQIRKLQNGGSTYGNLTINGRTTNDPKEIERWISGLSVDNPESAAISGRWASWIRSGVSAKVNTTDNTIEFEGKTIDDYADLPGATKRQLNILASGKPTYGGNNFSTAFRNNIFSAGRFTFPDSEEQQQKSNKTKVSNGKIKVDYDTIDGVQKYSSNPSNALIDSQIKAYLDYLSNEKWGETNEWENSLGDNDRILKAWYSSFNGDRKAAQAAIDAALNEVRTKPWNEVSEASRELLAYFNIIGPDETQDSESSKSTSPYLDESGQVKSNATTENGKYGVFIGDGKNGRIKDALYTTFNAGSLPYLINQDRLGLFDLNDDYLNSVIYNGRIYKPDEIGQNAQLQQIMNNVEYLNNSSISPADAYEKLKDIFNYTDYADRLGNVALYDSDKHYIKNKNVRKYLSDYGISKAAILNATNAYDSNGNTIYEIYDYSHNGSGPYGLRSPFYLITNENGELVLTTADNEGKQHRRWDSLPYEFLNRGYGSVSGIYNRHLYDGKTYGRFTAVDESGETYHFAEDDEGNVYHLDKNGVPQLITRELAEKILRGEPFNPRELHMSKKDAARKKNSTSINGNGYSTGGGRSAYRKNGGKIKELPEKFQPGGKMWETPTEITDLGPINDPSTHGANGEYADLGNLQWNKLRPQDRHDLEAAGLDIISAISALFPGYGSAVAGVTGLGSTALLTASDIQNKLPAGKVIRNAGINAGLDLVSLLPYAGETAALAKIGKTVGRVGHLLVPMLNGMGLYVAKDAAIKVINGEKLSTDDYRALAAGITSVLNIGHGVARHFGDAALVKKANDARLRPSSNTTDVPKHEKEVFLAEGKHKNAGTKQKVELKEQEVNAILNENDPKKAVNILRRTLDEKYKVAKTELPKDDIKLLKDWGFDVDTHHTKIRVTKAQRQAEGTIENIRETPAPKATTEKKSSYIASLFNTATKRNEVIDEAMKDPQLRSKIDAIREKGQSGKFGIFGGENAYQRARKRIGEQPVNWLGVARKQQPTQEAAETSVQQQSTPQQQSSTQNTSGNSNAGSNTNNTSQQSPNSTAGTPRESNSSAEQVKASAEVVNNASSVTASNVTRSFKTASMEKRAANLRRLQKSSNPLKTLSALERSNNDKLFTNKEEFDAVLDAIIKSNKYRGGNKTVEKYNNKLIEKLTELEKAGRLYKRGGIIKAQNGLNTNWTKVLGSTIGYPIDIATTMRKKGHDLLSGSLPKGPDIKMPENKVVQQNPVSLIYPKVEKDVGQTTGWRYKNWNGIGNIVQPILSGIRYFSQKHGRNEVYDEQKEALNAGRVSRSSISLPMVPTYSVAHQHLENQLNQQMMNGIKPIASDLSAYYAAKLQQQAALNNGLQNNTAQKADLAWRADIQNQQTKSQEALQNNEIAFENAKMNASVNSGLHQLEAAKLAEEQASRDNLLYEIQQKLYQDQQTMMQGSIAARNQKNADDYQAELQRRFPNEWAKWQTVDQNKYNSFEEYVSSVNPTLYNQKKVDLENFKEGQNNELIRTTIQGKMNYPWLYGRIGGYRGPAGFKKGGRVNGTTRYTLEPDERIWIDNNKAAHTKAAKLNDAAIKLLLRALK